MGAEALYELLEDDWILDALSYDLRHKANTETSQQRKNEALKDFRLLKLFRVCKEHIENRPEWMIVKGSTSYSAGITSISTTRWWSICNF